MTPKSTNERERQDVSARTSDTVNEQNAGVKSLAENVRAPLRKAKRRIEEIEARTEGQAE